MVVKYDVTVQPVKLICNACRRGATYVISYERRSSAEYVSHPQPASRDGEVVYDSATAAITVPSFTLNFDSAKDKKLLSFALYDFSRRPKVERVLEFEVPLGDYVDCMARQSFCELRSFPFRSGKFVGELRVILRMFPVGEAVIPTMTPIQATSVVRGDVLQTMQDEKLVPASVQELEGDADILDELTVKARLLKQARTAKRTTDPALEARCQRRAELEVLLEELEASERRDGGRSQLDSADRHMLELLDEEKRNWQDAIAHVGAVGSTDATPSPAKPSSPNVADPGLLQELNLQKGQLSRHLENLHNQQHRRDVTQEAINTLDAIKHIDNVIDETTKAAQRPQGSSGGASQRRAQVRFKEDSDDATPEGLAQRLLHAHCDCEALQYSVNALELVKNKPYDGFEAAMRDYASVPVPKRLQGISNNRRRGAPARSPVSSPATAQQNNAHTRDLLEDLFATAPPASVQNRSTTATVSTRASASAAIDDLFGPPTERSNSPQATLHQPAQPPVVPVATQPQQPSPQLPQFEVLPIPTTTTATKFAQFPHLSIRCQAVKFADWSKTKFIRGAEVEFRNDGQNNLTVSDINAFQEDIFASTETPMQCKCNTSMCVVPSGGRTATVYLSFGANVSMTNGVMTLLRVTVVTESGSRMPDSVRVTL